MTQKIRVIKLYTEGIGIRAIERIEKISASLIIYWIRNFSKIIRERLNTTEIPEDFKNIQILEIDELFTYYKKNPKNRMYGLLWTESGIKLLMSQ